MLDETVGNLNFLKETIGKFKNEIQKFIADPNYVNSNAMNLRQRIEELEKNILHKEKSIAGQILNNNKSLLSLDNKNINIIREAQQPINNNNINGESTFSNLPNIYNYAYNTLRYEKRGNTNYSNYVANAENYSNSNFNTKKTATSKVFDALERDEFKKNVMARRIRDPNYEQIAREKSNAHTNKRETEKILKQYILIRDNTNTKTKRSVGHTNYMDKQKLLKYSTVNKSHYQAKIYDSANQPVITPQDMEKGLLNMIYKGLVPKVADLTPAFNKHGNPFTLTNKVKEIYTKTKLRDDIETDIGYTKTNIKETKKGEGLFITVPNPINTGNRESSIKETDRENNENAENNEYDDNIENYQENTYNNENVTPNHDKKEIRTSLDKTDRQISEEGILEDFIINNKSILIFSHYKLILNEDYFKFRSKNEERWGVIAYMVEHLIKVFKKLNFALIEVDGNKLEKLASDELRSFTIKDFLGCITDKELSSKGIDLNNPRSLSVNIRDMFLLRIQNLVRRFLARLKTNQLKNLIKRVRKLQRFFRLQKLIRESKKLISFHFEKNLVKWKEMMSKFKGKWKDIKTGKRIEIHINSLSYSSYEICTIEKFKEKENNQLSRLIALADPNVEIIYVAPFDMGKEVLSYYFSILQTLGVENAKERFHLIIPDMKEDLPPNFSISQLLFCSNHSLSLISKFIKGREHISYIVPGACSDIDLKVSMYLNCPILMNDHEMTNLLFTKSGSKRVFELNDIALPISAWDIKTEDQFYDSLTDLVKNYLTINIWIFKIDSEHHGRGIAYVVLDKIKSFVDLKKEKLNNIISDDKFVASLKLILRKTVPKKAEIVTNKIFRCWEEYFAEFCSKRGVIESCPTNSLSSILGCPAVSFFIEPDGNVDFVCSYDKLNVNNFRNFGCVSPQQSIPNLNSGLIVQKLGKNLYEQGIIGFVTVEFITFIDNLKVLFWGIDLKFGLTDIISNIKFCEFLYNFPNKSPTAHNHSYINENSMIQSPSDYFIFSFPCLVHYNISNIKMKDLVHYFRSDLLVFDLEKKSGIIFNLSDVLQCGMFGISGITHSLKDCWKLIDNSTTLLKAQIFNKDFKTFIDDYRSDLIELNDIISKVKLLYKNLVKDNKI